MSTSEMASKEAIMMSIVRSRASPEKKTFHDLVSTFIFYLLGYSRKFIVLVSNPVPTPSELIYAPAINWLTS